MTTAIALALATFVSEDLACISAGLLIQRGELNAATGVVACALGILLGDWGLWIVGRFGGRAAAAWPWMARRLSRAGSDELRSRLERHAGTAIVASRFLPGTRLPLYVTAGFVGVSGLRFVLWTSLAVMLWTPAIVLLSASSATGLMAAALLLLVVRTAHGRWRRFESRRWLARLSRWQRWEFWPMWLFYVPVAGWVALLAIRYRGVTTMTAANPGIDDGGVVGESKFAILSHLPPDAVIPAERIDPGGAAARVAQVVAGMSRNGWGFPCVLKPDAGQRGVGVRLVRSLEEVTDYVTRADDRALILQPYHPGPFEAGIFYYRMPGSERGRIFSITDKHFPVIVGDGRSSVEDLIWAHPRYRLQAELFLERHARIAGDVLPDGARLQLAIAGNHAQGTLFRDGSHLLTPELERRVDEIARFYPGFFVGRFDVRYRDVEAFKAGRDLAIVELNGATAESTNIYDPDTPLLSAYARLFRQWAIVFQIGWANRSGGAPATSLGRLMSLVGQHLATKSAVAISD